MTRAPCDRPRVMSMLAAMVTGASASLAWLSGASSVSPSTAEVGLVAMPPPYVEARPYPIRVLIPAISVAADIEPVRRGVGGLLDLPAQWRDAGWYADGVVPGDRGPAVIVGHVDSRSGPAAFYRLPALRPGDVVLIDMSAGGTREFVVDSSREVPKTAFPTEEVYGPTPLAELRLITCTGSFDAAARSYSDNLIVTAHVGAG